MKRRAFLQASALAGAGFLTGSPAGAQTSTTRAAGTSRLRAGFARETITPPIGTAMLGFGTRDAQKGCERVHDDLYVRALFLEHGGERALILAYDLCFLGRDDADRLKGALGRSLDLAPRQILLNASHTHAGPRVGTWYWAGYQPPDRLYLERLEKATLRAANRARGAAVEATLWAQLGQTTLPLSRRKPDGRGGIVFAPNPAGRVYNRLPVCQIRDAASKTLCLLFSVAAHPSMAGGFEISADYPGVACRLLDEHLGGPVSLFLQGAGGDAKPRVIGQDLPRWRDATWEDIERAGRLVADETQAVLDRGLVPVEPGLRSALVETAWPLQALPPRSAFETIVRDTKPQERAGHIRCQWAARQIERLDRDDGLPGTAGVLVHVLHLGQGLRFAGLEGEPVSVWGDLLQDFFALGVTFPLGYCNGQGLYLPVSRMISEGGYEVESYWEYGHAAPLAAGMEDIVLGALARMHSRHTG